MTETTQPAGTPSWHVTGQVEQTQVDPSGRIVEGMRIMYLTGQGVAGSVFLPMALYDPGHVRAAISQAAASNDAIAGLTSEG